MMQKVDRGAFYLATSVTGRPEGAPWIVLSNSLGASMEMWMPQLELLGQHYRVLSYDTRGHGRSDAPEGPYSFDDLVGDVVALLDHFRIKKADFMGLSLGGMTGLGLAINHPERVRRLICCDARADAPEGFVKSWDERINAIEAGGLGSILRGTMERWFSQDFRDNQPDQMAAMGSMFLETSVTGYKGCAAALKTLDYLKDLDKIACPTLYIVGDEDFGAPPAVMKDMAERTPGAVMAEIAGAAHIANVDEPEAFNAAIKAFLGLT
ncbi:3-oxoadipate enol-lactonase [Breoghania sp. L-A4]|uniref:3-oxoadipate enol-lactonase n=1 Tax=Breoghania sp. L-A4 TaxID=2304600 RepID=UPI000E360786|nr:3-oxoadipate enol-lactonase [Breoghania sp. L-A4]AXS41760.1 3-oxoadipate enol-lactonase [Breoghania sp. L-A4]